jgi:hypothetical protein
LKKLIIVHKISEIEKIYKIIFIFLEKCGINIYGDVYRQNNLMWGIDMDFTAFKEVISKIDGIISSKVVVDKDNITEIHVLASNSRSPKQVVRDIESTLLASFNYRIDRKKISVAQIRVEDTKNRNRIKFSGVLMKTHENTVECSVKLIYEEEYSVTQVGINTAANRRKIVADSTIKTVEKILGQAFVFDVKDVIVTTVNDITFVSVLVNMVYSGKEETMVGSAIVKNDINETIAKSALDAINRRVQKVNM